MDMVVLDLEWNTAYSRRLQGYINEIIEFGAVKCGPNLKKIGTFSCFVKPQVGKHVNALVTDLTSITDENLEDGLTFTQAVSKFRKWAGDCVVLTWSTSDVLTLIENCRYFSGRPEVPFLQTYCNLQQYVQAQVKLGLSEQVGLSKAAELLELDVSKMAHHRALDDSLMALEILRKVYDPEALKPFLEPCDEEFYRRITFKTTYISDLDNPLVDKSHLQFSCPKCGGEGQRDSRWALKNKSFRAVFHCSQCGHRFGGRLLIKLKYEGLTVNKKTFPVPQIEAPRQGEAGPLGNMRLDVSQGVGILRFPALEQLQTVNHAFSTRMGGVSSGAFAAMNLSAGRGDPNGNVLENFRIFCKAAGFDSQSLVTGAQDHHTVIQRVGAEHRGRGVWKPKGIEGIDGLCTNEPGVTLVIYCSDCVPLYFVDNTHRAIGLAHAGWRGTAAGMAKAMVEKLAAEYGTRPEDIRAAIGPSICKDCFEVDGPVAEEFQKLPGAEHFVFGPVDGKYHVDLWECNRRFLLDAGVLEEHITVGYVCTMEESDLLFSHRKTRGQRGGNCAFLALK